MIADAVVWLSLLTGTPLSVEHAALLPEITPLAESLGVQERGAAVVDASFRLLQPTDHGALVASLPPIEADQEALDGMHTHLEAVLPGPDAYVTSRRKSLYSTWQKMERKQLDASAIADRLAARIHVDTIDECYNLIDQLHQDFDHIPGEFDDYIASPKGNGYQSIHTVLQVPTRIGFQPVEVQLRTHAMHHAAEHGDAAHWKYKRSA